MSSAEDNIMPDYKTAKMPGHPILGALPQMRRDPLEFLDTCASAGDIVQFRLAHRRAYGVHHPDLVKQVLLKDYEHFVKQGIYSRLRPVFRKGLITSMGSLWKRQRRTMQPMFSSKNMHTLISTIESEVHGFKERLLKHADSGQPVDLFEQMLQITLDIVTSTMFSTDVSDRHSEVSEHVHFLNHYLAKLLYSLAPPMLWLPTPANLRYHSSMRALDAIIMEMVEKRQKRNDPGTDLLGMLLSSEDPETGEKMSMQQVRDEAVTMFLAGHETTATALTWTFYLMDRHPEVRERVCATADQVLSKGDKGVDAEQLKELDYLNCVFLESLRMRCPVPLIYREAARECDLGGCRIRPGDTVYVSPYVSNKDDRFWDEPASFNPERFTEGKNRQISNFLFFPFGAGPRSCIGSRFAMLEAQLIMGILGQSLNLVAESDAPAKPQALVTMRPRDTVWMRVERR
jgi:cytochrome P450